MMQGSGVGDFRKDSDWDFLILTDRKVTIELEDEILDKLYEIELEVGEVITSVIENRKIWEDLELTSLYKNVKREGVVIELVQNGGTVPTTVASSGSSMP